MALANMFGGLLKKATGSNPSLHQAIRCMSSNASSVSERRKEEDGKRKRESPFLYRASLYRKLISCSGAPFTKKIRIKRIKLPTHYVEVNYKILKAVVYYGPDIGHIPQVSDAVPVMDGKSSIRK